jgi:aspartate/methionine/tyrosine aminotransferase
MGALTGDTLMRRLIVEHRVAAVCGESFGCPAAQPVLRLSYGLLDAASLDTALQRLFSGFRAILAAPCPSAP